MHLLKSALSLLVLSVLLAGCSTQPPLSDQLTLVPVSDENQTASGLSLTYLSGNHGASLKHVSCNTTQNCWFSGVLGTFQQDKTRINSLVIRTSGTSLVDWAQTYQINDTYTDTNGLVTSPDGGALLYGNTLISDFPDKLPEPVYEKVDASGNPQWGGALLIGGFAPWSAFSDAIHLQGGGYLLAGSGYMQKDYWSLLSGLKVEQNHLLTRFARVGGWRLGSQSR